MKLPASTVVICEDNETLAELYALWLEECEVRIALTERQAKDELDSDVAVVVLNQNFADGAASALLPTVRERVPVCDVLATRERAEAFPALSVDHHLVKPIFEDALVEKVQTLLRRVNYRVALERYYSVTIAITTLDLKSTLTDDETTRHEELTELVGTLQRFLSELREEMTEEDVAAVMQNVTIDTDVGAAEMPQKVKSKYRPAKCSNCGHSWEPQATGESGMERLGAYVWQCKRCGDVQMHADPSYQHLSSYRK